MKRIFIYTALALIVVLGSYQFVMARPGQNRGNTPQGNNRLPINYVKALKLTDDQVSKITTLVQNNNTVCTTLEDKIQANRNNLQILEWSKDFSTEKVQALSKEMRDTMTQLQLSHEKLIVDIKLLLTTDQLQIYNRLLSGTKEKPGQERQVPTLFGKMSNINLTDKTFSLTTKDPQGNDVTFKVTYHERTKFVRNKENGKPEDFKDGEEISVVGIVNMNNKTIEAAMVVLGKIEPPKNPGR